MDKNKSDQLRKQLSKRQVDFSITPSQSDVIPLKLLRLVGGGYSNGKSGEDFVKATFGKGRSTVE